MKKKIIILTAVIFTAVTIIVVNYSTTNSQSEAKYVGVNTCVGACHKTESQGSQLSIWQNSKHSEAYTVLQSARADSIATARGSSTPAVETQECLKCHTITDADPGKIEETFDMSRVCSAKPVMVQDLNTKAFDHERQAKAMDAGLIIHTEKAAFCTGCHNSESPTFVSFDYDTMWDKIKHPKPAKEE
ncbi:MAG: cytochrome C554 [Ignavibacteria bacterium]|nr:cytochrome C554 [Ignavibacteria bacterium]